MHNNINIYKKSILTIIVFLSILLFSFILYKSYKISKIKENINNLPIIKSEKNIIKIKKEVRELEVKTNNFYKNLEENNDKIKITDDNKNKEKINNQINNDLNTEINNIINDNTENNLKDSFKSTLADESIKTIIINEKKAEKEEKTKSKKKENNTNNNYYKAQLIALKNKQQANNFVEKTKKIFDNMLKNLDVFIVEIDLDNKGTFYRVQVGNFNSKDDASNFCKEYLKITIKNPTNCIVVK